MKYKSFIAGLVIILLIILSLMLVSKVSDRDRQISNLNDEIEIQIMDYNGLMIAYEDAINADDNAACIATMRDVLRAYDYDE